MWSFCVGKVRFGLGSETERKGETENERGGEGTNVTHTSHCPLAPLTLAAPVTFNPTNTLFSLDRRVTASFP